MYHRIKPAKALFSETAKNGYCFANFLNSMRSVFLNQNVLARPGTRGGNRAITTSEIFGQLPPTGQLPPPKFSKRYLIVIDTTS